MAKTRSLVVIGMPGSNLDQGADAGRWEKWRPTVDLCRHEHLLVDRFELLHQPQHARLSERLAGDITSVSPETAVRTHALDIADMWDFEQVYGALHDFASAYPFAPGMNFPYASVRMSGMFRTSASSSWMPSFAAA